VLCDTYFSYKRRAIYLTVLVSTVPWTEILLRAATTVWSSKLASPSPSGRLDAGLEETAAKRKHVEPDSPVQLEPEIAEPVPEVRATEGDAATVTQSTAVVELQQRTVYPSEGILSSTKFESLEICEKLSKAIQSMGHEYLTHIQDAAIPQLLKGHDLLGAARTGAPLQLSAVICDSQKLHTLHMCTCATFGAH
jgi:hypothetical protein